MKKQQLFTLIGIIFLSITAYAQTTYNVGDRAQGGIVFWVDGTGQHGLVFDIETHPEPVQIKPSLGTQYRTIYHTKDGIYGGEANTTMFNTTINLGLAAEVHNPYDPATEPVWAFRLSLERQVSQGETDYIDWYIPCVKELDLLFHQLKEGTIELSEEEYQKFFVANFLTDYDYNQNDVWSSTVHPVNKKHATLHRSKRNTIPSEAYAVLIRSF